MKQSARSQRVGCELQRELSLLIQRELKDPRISGIITVTHVEVSTDFAIAKVYISCLNDTAEQKKIVLDQLAHAAGFLRSQCAKLMKLRTVPELKFVYDETLANANKLTSLINSAIAEDQFIANSSKEK